MKDLLLLRKRLENRYMRALITWKGTKSKRDAEAVTLLEQILQNDLGYTDEELSLLQSYGQTLTLKIT